MTSAQDHHRSGREQQDTIRRLLLEKYEPIAIVGIGLRFPGDNETPDEFAEFLRAGRSGIRPVPGDRWDVAAFAPADEESRGKIRTAGGGFLDQIDQFDAQFFNISPKEAPYVDPQQRLLLETAWAALEHANIDPSGLRRGNGGVYIGASSIDYALEIEAIPYEKLEGHLAAGITLFPISGRLSYFLGWHGPCLTVDTACASSLTALHAAVSGLRRGECDIALCGAVNALHHPRTPVVFSHANMLAPDGQCKTFDEAADGYVRAEGCGVLVLKRFSEARRAGDRILGLVRGTAVGQDGDSAGLTVPNGTAQAMVMRSALSAAMLGPGDVQYVEAHGTGTPLGDPIEMGAIADVFAGTHSKADPVVVGSVKTNLGHMEPVAGIVGIIKTVLQMQAGMIFPHLNFRNPSGRIPWDSYPVEVPTECRPWVAATRRAVVNSFGFAGTISAAVIEEPPPRAAATGPAPTVDPAPGGHVFTLSAKGKRAMLLQVERYRSHLAKQSDVDVADLCYTTNVGRAHFNVRVAAEVRDRAALADFLDRQAEQLAKDGARAGDFRKAAFLFAGQGAQYAGMGEPLYARFPAFREAVDECDHLFAPYLGRSLRAIMLGTATDPEVIDQTRYTQPALFTLEYALAQLWLSWGVRPSALIGHSIGEVVAATVAGLFPLADAVMLVANRARLMQSVTAPGGMVAVAGTGDEVAPLLDGYPDVALAAINSPGQCVVSGGTDSLRAVTALIRERGLTAKPLTVSHAFHSPLMAEVLDEFRAALAGVRFTEPVLTIISNLTGRVARFAEIATPDYWVRHIAEPVRFEEGMRTIDRRGRHVFVEIGPSAALTSLARQCVPADNHRWVSCLHPRDEDATTIRRAVAQAYTAGLSLSWEGFHRGRSYRKVTLPTYGFDRRRYWLPVDQNRHGLGTPRAAGAASHPLLATETSTSEQLASGERQFAARIDRSHPAYLADHLVNGEVLVPTSLYVETLFALQDAVYGHTRRPIENLRVHATISLPEEHSAEIRTRLRTLPDGTAEAELHSGEVHLASAILGVEDHESPSDVPTSDGTGGTPTSGEDLYASLAAAGMDHGPEFQRLLELRNGVTVEAELRGGPASAVEHLPPPMLEGALQAMQRPTEGEPPLWPVRVGSLRLFRKPRAATSRVVSTRDSLVILEGDEPVAEVRDVSFGWPEGAPALAPRHFLHHLQWIERELPSTGTPPRHVLAVGASVPVRRALAAHCAGTPTRLTVVNGAGAAIAALSGPDVTDVCWFWRSSNARVSAASLRRESERNYRDLLALIEGLTEARGLRLWLVSERAQWLPDDTAGTGERLAAASLWGFGRVLFNEYPTLRVSLVDLPTGAAGAGALIDEMGAGDSGEYQIAFRNGKRYLLRLLPGDGAEETVDADHVRPDRTYVITGGLGALGLATAQKLVDLGARHLALVSRSGAPAADALPRWERLQALADVTVHRADIADSADVTRLTKALRAGAYPVGGIIHAAGLLDDKPVSAQSWDTIDPLFQSKVYGAWLLHEATRSWPELDFFVGFSSAAAVLGGASQSNYAAANAFLDGLIHWRARQGLPGLSLNWGPWSEAGMSARLSPQHVRALEGEGIRFFTPARALTTMMSLLGRPVTQVGVGECDWDRFLAAKPVVSAMLADLATGSPTGPAIDLAALLAAPDAERTARIEEFVRVRVAGVLHLDDVDIVEPEVQFVDLGLDSLMAVELKNGLEAALRIPLPASAPFDHPCAQQLAQFLTSQLPSWRPATGQPVAEPAAA